MVIVVTDPFAVVSIDLGAIAITHRSARPPGDTSNRFCGTGFRHGKALLVMTLLMVCLTDVSCVYFLKSEREWINLQIRYEHVLVNCSLAYL